MNNLFSDYISDRRKSVMQARHLERMSEELYALDDTRLRILNNTGYHTNPAMEVFELTKLHLELQDDLAFKSLRKLYGELLEARNVYGLTASLQMEAVQRHATDLVNRRMKEWDYQGFARGLGKVFNDSQEILEQKAELIRNQEY